MSKMLPQITLIQPEKDLYNSGKCFSKGKTYTVNKKIGVEASLMDEVVTNDFGERHIIGYWWRNFKIVK